MQLETDVQPAAGSTSPGGDEERHHAVIVFADVVGYSRLIADDEPGTLNRWTALYKNELIPEAARRRGQVGDLRGDGTLLEFEQVADPVEWSMVAHRAAAATGIGDTAPLALRRAIHQGTVFSTRDGLFGDAVNIAARLQEHAAPGGTVISQSVKEALSEGPGEPLFDLGRLRFKNDDCPFRAFALGGGHVPPRPRSIGTLPSIAVLPLVNLSGDEADAYLAAGVVDDVIQSLAGLSELTVISRGSTVGCSGPGADPVIAGRELGARYVLTGSLSRAGDAVASPPS